MGESNNKMNFVNSKKGKLLITTVSIIVLILGVYIFTRSDEYLSTNEIKVYYKVKTNNWSWWSKNGSQAGDLKTPIKDIKTKIRTKYKGNLDLRVYSKGSWSNSCLNNTECNFNKNISGIKVALTGTLVKRYNVYYRVHVDKKWTKWTSNGKALGDKNKKIDGIEIKIIPENVNVKDYIEDYDGEENNLDL